MAKKKKKINVEGLEIRIKESNDYLSLTDIAKKEGDRQDRTIGNWLRNAGTLDFLLEWELMYNEGFNYTQYEGIRIRAGAVNFNLSAKEWIEKTGATGIESRAGRYGGTFAHKDIAYEFASAINAKFKLSLIQTFDALLRDKYQQLGQPFAVQRILSKGNFKPLQKAITINNKKKAGKTSSLSYATELDMINEIVFGMTARQWKIANPTLSGNQRDYATIPQLMAINALQIINERLIKYDSDLEQRRELLKEAFQDYLPTFQNSKAVKAIEANLSKKE